MNEIINTTKTHFEEQPQVPEFWKFLALFLLGVIVGFLCSPIKGGINPVIASNNQLDGNSAKALCGDDEDDEDDD